MRTTSVEHISSNVDALPDSIHGRSKTSRDSMRSVKREIRLINPTLLFCMLRLQALRIAGLQPWEPYCVARAHAMAVSCQHSLNTLGHTILSPLFFTLVICTTLHLRAWHWKVLRHENNNPCPLFHCHFQRRDHVDKYGFDGIRVDAARHINRTLQCYHAVTWRDLCVAFLHPCRNFLNHIPETGPPIPAYYEAWCEMMRHVRYMLNWEDDKYKVCERICFTNELAPIQNLILRWWIQTCHMCLAMLRVTMVLCTTIPYTLFWRSLLYFERLPACLYLCGMFSFSDIKYVL